MPAHGKLLAKREKVEMLDCSDRRGEVRSGLVQEILTKIPFEKIIWEAPQKAQQVWFVKLLGANVNLGNIAPEEVIPLETIRLGLRGDTFLHFLGIERKNTNTAPPFEID